jgi:DNA (cytosine-5)-methyltransferase 1
MLRERSGEGWFPGLEIIEGDIREVDFEPFKGRVDQISAGFPCQDISAAGKGAGIKGKKSGLISEVWRSIDTIKPSFVFLENSPAIRTRGREVVIAELVARGYSWKDGKLGAFEVGAPHKRDRWWCLASNADGIRKLQQEGGEQREWGWFGNFAALTSDLDGFGQKEGEQGTEEWRGPGDKICTEKLADSNFINGDMGRLYPGTATKLEEDSVFGCAGPPYFDGIGLQESLWGGGVPEEAKRAILATTGHTQAYDWLQANSGVCRVLDGLSDPMDAGKGQKGKRIKACGNAQVPLQAALAWLCLAFG